MDKAETAKKGSVLIVDDEKANILTLTNILSHEYTIYAARNGQDAIEMIENNMPDLILLDIVMPDMDGYEVITRLKSSDNTKDIPVLFITGLSDENAEEKGLALGASDYISKPFNSAIVTLRVRNQIQILEQIKIIKKFSMTDMLTELPNRRNFDYRIQLEWDRARRDKTPLSLSIMDIDKFKNYNDTYGHLQGDVAIQTIAKMIMQSLNRSVDFAARWGGEEFCILLPSTNLAGAIKTTENVRKNIEDTTIPYIEGTVTKITVSAGVNTVLPLQGGTIRDFIDGADQALYAAKESGRNRVCSLNK